MPRSLKWIHLATTTAIASAVLCAPAFASAPFALMELFTSEGCSSCPPADRVLARIAADADKSGKAVFALSFHVDYWNELGWKDPFSRPEFSQRQRNYADFLSGRVYTPQMIVNGAREFVGSREDLARKAMDSALAQPGSVAIAVDAVFEGDGILRVSYRTSGHGSGDVLDVALAESGLFVEVKAGENRGRTLRHAGVVRAFRSLILDERGSGSVRIAFPPGMRRNGAVIVAYAHKADFPGVTGAARARVPP